MSDLPEGFVLETPPLPDGFVPEDNKAQALAQSMANIKAQHDRISPAGDSFLGNLPAAIGQGATDVAYGGGQFLAHTSPLAQLYEHFAGSGPISAIDQAVTQKAQTDKPLLDAPGGSTGNFIGNALALSPISRGSPALQGAVSGAMQPVPNVGQNIEGLITGQQPTDYFNTKGTQIGVGAATGYGTQKILQGAGALVNKLLNPAATVLNGAAGKAATSEFAKEGEDLAARTGVPLTPGEVTGSKAQISLENNSRQSIASKNIAFAADQTKTQKWVDYLNRTLDNISTGSENAASAGERVQGAVKNAVADISGARESAAAADYGKVRALLQGKPAVMPQSYLSKLQELGQEFAGGPEGSDYAKLSKTLSSLQETGLQNADIATLMKTRRFLSQVAGGQVQLAGDTGRGLQKSVATQLLGAIDQDLDASASKLGGPVGDMLKQANARYRDFSQKIDGLQNSALGKLVGQDFADAVGNGTFNQIPGETVMQRLSALKPSQLAGARGVLEKYDPDTWQAVKRTYLETALQKAQAAAPSDGANVIAARPNVFVNALAKTPEDQARLATIFSPKEQFEINDAIAAARRMSDKSGFNASGTAQAAEMTAAGSATTAALLGHPVPLLAIGGKMLTNRQIATVMLNSQGRALVQQLNRLPPGSQRFTQLSAQLAAMAAAQNADQIGSSGQ